MEMDTEVVRQLRHQLGGVGQGSADSVGGVTLTKLCVRCRQRVPVLNDCVETESNVGGHRCSRTVVTPAVWCRT